MFSHKEEKSNLHQKQKIHKMKSQVTNQISINGAPTDKIRNKSNILVG